MVKMVPFYVVYFLTTFFFFKWKMNSLLVMSFAVRLKTILSSLWWLMGGQVLPSCWNWPPTPLGDSNWSHSAFIYCCCWGKVRGSLTVPLRFVCPLPKPGPGDPLHAPHSTSSWVAGWRHLSQQAFFLVPVHTCGWKLLPLFSFSRPGCAWFVSALSGDSRRCNSHGNKPAS